MARALSPVYTVIRGSVAGNTYTANTYHPIVVRSRVAPVQPQSPTRTAIRYAFSSAVAAWTLATPTQRQAWNDYAKTVWSSGPLGAYQPSGRDLAIGQYSASAYLNWVGGLSPALTLSMEAPIESGKLAIDNVQVLPLTASGTGFSIKIGQSNGEDCIGYMSRSLKTSVARNFWSGPFLPGTLTMAEIADQTTESFEFPGLVEDGVYFVKIRMITKTPGRRMAPSTIVRAVAQVTV